MRLDRISSPGVVGVVVVLAAAFAAARPAPPRIASAPDGASVYRENCAACHGKEGHGDGDTAKTLKYKPRDFREGKFAFGNTPGAMVKTVMSGIPGEETARMPAFKSVLEPADIDAVVAYVRTMMPVEPAPTPTDMKLAPRDGALVVRGILPSLEKDGPPIARGLLVGLPSGFSFEYATENVRLLAVRRGEFVSRTDWEERGGRPLTPLGSVVFEAAQPPDWSTFWSNMDSDGNGALKTYEFRAKLRSTSVRNGVAQIEYDLVESGRVVGHVRERPREIAVSDGAGIVQEFEVTSQFDLGLSFAAACDPTLVLPRSSTPKSLSERGYSDENSVEGKHLAAQWQLAEDTGWWVVPASKSSLLAVGFAGKWRGGSPTPHNHRGSDVIDVTIRRGTEPTTITRVIVARGATTLEQLEKMTTETKELR